MPMLEFSNRRLGNIIKSLKLSDGCVIVLKAGIFSNQQVDDFAKLLEKTKYKDIVVIVSEELTDVKALPAKEMSKHGWYRVEALRNIIARRSVSQPTKQEEQHDGSTEAQA